jgi:hypothetical protein
VNVRQQIKDAAGFDLQRLLERFGAPTLIAVLVLGQLTPKIDRGIQIADHVDAELQYLAAVGCAPRGATLPFAALDSDSLPQFPPRAR